MVPGTGMRIDMSTVAKTASETRKSDGTVSIPSRNQTWVARVYHLNDIDLNKN